MYDGIYFAARLYLFAQIGYELILPGRDVEGIEVIILVYIIKGLFIVKAVKQ